MGARRIRPSGSDGVRASTSRRCGILLRLAEDFAIGGVLTAPGALGSVRGYHTPRGAHVARRSRIRPPTGSCSRSRSRSSSRRSTTPRLPRGQALHHPARVPYRGYDLKDLTLVRGRASVECWQPIQGATARRLDFMARHGIGLIAAAWPRRGDARGRRGLSDALRGPGARPSWARGSASDSTSSSPPQEGPSRPPPDTSKRTSRCSAAAAGPLRLRGADRRDGRSQGGADAGCPLSRRRRPAARTSAAAREDHDTLMRLEKDYPGARARLGQPSHGRAGS